MRAAVRLLAMATFVLGCACALAAVNTPAPLAGTRWQLVRIIGLDDQLTIPDDPTRYAVEFDASGRASLRADCNRTLTTWTSPGAGRVQFGAFASTRAACGPASLADRALRELPAIRSYSIRDGHLFLAALDETAAIWEFAPLTE
ncbi:MAG: META domain-containing protein [Casimicrobiaceae bacterium]